MKAFTGKISGQKTGTAAGRGAAPISFGPDSLLRQAACRGGVGLAALRALLRLAGELYGEARFPYTRTADALLDTQLAVYGIWSGRLAAKPGAAVRWGQAVWLERQLRPRLVDEYDLQDFPPPRFYQESLRFGWLMGVPLAELPASEEAFDRWAASSLTGQTEAGFRRMALDCLSGLAPLFWPVNLALLCDLLPEEFWQGCGQPAYHDGLRLAGTVRSFFSEMAGGG